MSVVDALRSRLKSYRPTLDPLIFGTALVGVLVVAHLYIQQGRGFEDGCLGVSSFEGAQQLFDCSAVVGSQAGTLLGVSNLFWGLGFYLGVVGLTFVGFWTRPVWRQWIQGGRLGLITGGMVYSGYLVFVQTAQLDAFCALCLLSTAVVTALFVMQVGALVAHPQSTEPSMDRRLFKREIVRYAYLTAIAVVLVGADVSYFEEAGADRQDSATGNSTSACQLESTAALDNGGASLVAFQDITKGPSDADVTVIEYFDPNCPHCKTFHGTMKQLVGAYQDSVRFVFKPFPLRRGSLPEIQALYVAHQQGTFTEMLEAQYDRQKRSGITTEDLRTIASEIGMNPDVLLSRVEQGRYREQILEQRKQAVKVGVDSTPTVIVNGHFVQSRSLDCMNTFIERARKGTLGSMASR